MDPSGATQTGASAQSPRGARHNNVPSDRSANSALSLEPNTIDPSLRTAGVENTALSAGWVARG